ncbi:hypothetical protein R5R35_004192 [Gryllus longicercus]|uniref:Acyltransferase C-terminal domain-containing protein n=1 Tax=Gryllus longicercus TaxID=2509291 RepID=A0AAN9VIQ8_9ORTH
MNAYSNVSKIKEEPDDNLAEYSSNPDKELEYPTSVFVKTENVCEIEEDFEDEQERLNEGRFQGNEASEDEKEEVLEYPTNVIVKIEEVGKIEEDIQDEEGSWNGEAFQGKEATEDEKEGSFGYPATVFVKTEAVWEEEEESWKDIASHKKKEEHGQQEAVLFETVVKKDDDFRTNKGRERRDESLRALVRHLHDSYIPRRRKWMVLFPEGGFLRKRRDTSQKFALKNNLPVLQHVSLPRVGAMHTIVDVVGPSGANNNKAALVPPFDGHELCSSDLNWVLDITIAYPEGKPLDLGAIVTGYRPPCKTFLFYRLYPCKEVPRDHEEMTKWLYDRFIEKERMLDAYYKTGHFPIRDFCASPAPPHEVAQDALRFAALHLFFITSTYIHFQMLSYVISYFWY